MLFQANDGRSQKEGRDRGSAEDLLFLATAPCSVGRILPSKCLRRLGCDRNCMYVRWNTCAQDGAWLPACTFLHTLHVPVGALLGKGLKADV